MASGIHDEYLERSYGIPSASVDRGTLALREHHPDLANLANIAATFQLPALARQATDTSRDLAEWGQTFPLADSRRFGALALVAAIHLPTLGRRERALAARLNGWIYAFDDLIDGIPPDRPTAGVRTSGRLSESAIDRLARRCMAVVSIGDDRANDEDPDGIVAALAMLVHELRAYPRATMLTELWRDTFARMLNGILRERRLGAELVAGAPPPSPAAYLETARYSIGAPHYLVSGFIMHGSAADPGLAGRLPTLMGLALAAADVARLANDLRTWVREEGEGTFNSIKAADATIARLIPALPAPERRRQALDVVRHLLDDRRERVSALLSAYDTPHWDAEAGIGRLVSFISALYSTADFHDFGSMSPTGNIFSRDD